MAIIFKSRIIINKPQLVIEFSDGRWDSITEEEVKQLYHQLDRYLTDKTIRESIT